MQAFVDSEDESSHLCYRENTPVDTCDGKTQKDWLSVVIIFIGIFTVGMGSTGIFSFGIPYVDDNSSKENSPVTLSFAMASRIAGPTLGYILGSFCLRVFVNPRQAHGGKILH